MLALGSFSPASFYDSEESSPASMPREPELLFDFPYPYITVSTLKAIAFQVERLFKSVLSRLLVSKCLGPVRQLSSLPLSQVLSPVAASLPGLLRAMVIDGITIVLARTVLLSFMIFIEVAFLRS